MKKLFLFLSILLVAVSFNSCSNDDDNNIPDEIVGKWRLSQISIKIGQEFIDYMPTECDKKSTVEFFENGTHRENIFEFNDSNTCVALAPVNGTWKNLGNSVYDISDINIPGITVTSNQKITFDGNKLIMEFSGTLNIEGVQTPIICKVTLIDNDTFIPDSIIGTWRFDQEFINNVENDELTVCEKTMTIRFLEEGTYEQKEFEGTALPCEALEIKNGTWRNMGSDRYEISDLGVPEFKITFANNTMTVEFTDTEEGNTANFKLIFVKVTS